MAISQDIRSQYASRINRNIGLRSVNDNENNQQAVKLLSSNLSSFITVASQINSIIKNQTLLSRFEYKEKARIQKEINAETNNIAAIPAPEMMNTSGGDFSLIAALGPMFDDLTERVKALADSASSACTGSGLDIDTSRRRGSRRGAPGAPVPTGSKKTGSTLGQIGKTAAAVVGGAAVGLGLAAAVDYFTRDETDPAPPEGAKPAPAKPEVSSPAAAAAAPIVAMGSEKVTQAPKTAPPVKATLAKTPSGKEFVAPQGGDTGFKLTRNKDGSTSLDLTQEAKVVAQPSAPKAAPRPPVIPKPPRAITPSRPPARVIPKVSKPQPAASPFNWSTLFTSIAGRAPIAAAAFVVGKSIVTRAQEAITGRSPYADTGGAQGEKIPQGDTAGYLKTLYNAFRSKGITHEGAITMLAQIGRENGYQSRFLFGSHIDPKNGSMNIGMISWQGDRAARLAKYLESRGVMKNNRIIPGDEALRAQVDFMVAEMGTGDYTKSLKALKDPNLKYADIEGIIGDNYIRWARHNPLYAGSGYDNQNRWMRKARAMFDQQAQQAQAKPEAKPEPKPTSMFTSISEAATRFFNKVTGKESPVAGIAPGQFVLPVGKARISSVFSPARRNPVSGVVRPHNGVDFAVPVGTPVRAINDGTVIKRGNFGDGGWTIGIDHGNGWYTGYAHLSGFNVNNLTKVTKGQVIGFSGGQKGQPGAGASTGPHLHFGISKDGNWVNPLTVLKGAGAVMSDRDAANAATEEAAVKPAAIKVKGKPGWSLTPAKNDDPVLIQQRQVEKFAQDQKGKRPVVIQAPAGGGGSSVTLGASGGRLAAPRSRTSRDITSDFKRAFGL